MGTAVLANLERGLSKDKLKPNCWTAVLVKSMNFSELKHIICSQYYKNNFSQQNKLLYFSFTLSILRFNIRSNLFFKIA